MNWFKNGCKELEILEKLSSANQSKNGNTDLFSPQRRATIETIIEERTRKTIDCRHFMLTVAVLVFSCIILILAYVIDRGNSNIDAFSKVLSGALSIASLAVGSYLGRGSSMRKSEPLAEK